MSEDAVKSKLKRRRRTKRKKSVVDSAARNAAALSDGCNPELVIGAEFDGIFEIPIIKRPKKMKIPDGLVPFSKMGRADKKKFAVCEYENDCEFRDLLIKPEDYIATLKEYQGFIAPDCSVYRDMPLAAQITNIYRSRAIGYCFQKYGVYVVPCVRWGDERTYTTQCLPEKIAFLGVEKHSIVSIGTYGQLKNVVNRYYFEKGLDAMMETLESEVVLVYSKMPDELKEKIKMPTNDAQLKHFMRDGEGHLLDTPENRKLLLDLANDKKFHMGKDKYGNEWHVRKNNDGTQDWVRHQNQVINEGGRNLTERPWDPETGLFRNVSSKMRRKR